MYSKSHRVAADTAAKWLPYFTREGMAHQGRCHGRLSNPAVKLGQPKAQVVALALKERPCSFYRPHAIQDRLRCGRLQPAALELGQPLEEKSRQSGRQGEGRGVWIMPQGVSGQSSSGRAGSGWSGPRFVASMSGRTRFSSGTGLPPNGAVARVVVARRASEDER